MAETLIAPHPQPQFPQEDICELNAAFLAPRIASLGKFQEFHDASEEQLFVFRRGHPVLRTAVQQSFNVLDPLAVESGFMAFEVIAGAVQSNPGIVNLLALEANTMTLRTAVDYEGVSEYFLNARESFISELPVTSDVIREGTERLFPGSMHYVQLGAAIARQFELDNIGEFEALKED